MSRKDHSIAYGLTSALGCSLYVLAGRADSKKLRLVTFKSSRVDLSAWKRWPPFSMRTWTPSMPRSSSCSTRRCAASPSPSAAGSCSPPPTRPRLSGCAAGCRDGRRASSVRSCVFVDGHFSEYQRLGDAAIEVIGDFTPAGRADLHRRGLCRRRGLRAPLRPADGNRQNDTPPRAGGAGAPDLGGRGAHQAPRENRLAGGQARRAGRRRSCDRARRSFTTCRSS